MVGPCREEFALVFLTFDLMKDHYDKARFTPAMIEALREHYRPSEQIGVYHLYRPANTNTPPASEGRTEAMQSTKGKDPRD